MKTHTTALVCHQSQKKSRSTDGDGLAALLEEMEITAQNSPNLGSEGKRKRGRLKSTGRRTVEVERKQLGCNSWKMAENAARDRMKW